MRNGDESRADWSSEVGPGASFTRLGWVVLWLGPCALEERGELEPARERSLVSSSVNCSTVDRAAAWLEVQGDASDVCVGHRS
jgi:hypothetical protein